QKLEPMLVFVLENAFRSSTFDDFKNNFEKAFYDSTQQALYEKVKWKTPLESFAENQKPSGKKRIVFIHTEWCNTCRVMYRTTFADSSLQTYLNRKFDLVDFNPENKDVLYFEGDRKSTRLNSSHVKISYAVFCLKKKKHDSKENYVQVDA